MEIDQESNNPSSSDQSQQLNYEQAYEIFTSPTTSTDHISAIDQTTFEQKIESTLSIKFTREKHNEVNRSLKKRHSELRKLPESFRKKRLCTEFWRSEAYSLNTPGAQALNPEMPVTPIKQPVNFPREEHPDLTTTPAENLLKVTPP